MKLKNRKASLQKGCFLCHKRYCMRRFWLVCLLIMVFRTVNAQEFCVIDSLEALSKTQKGEAKVNTLLVLSEELRAISFDESIAVAELAEKEARKAKDMNLVAKACFALAESYYKRYDYDLAEQCLREAMCNVAQDDYKAKLNICKRLAAVTLRTSNADTAAIYYTKVCETAQVLGDKLEYADAVNNLALISRNKGNQEEAMKGFEDAVALYYEANDSLAAARSLSNVAMLHYAKNQYEEALSILEKLKPFFERRGENKDLARTYSNLGLISSRYTGDVDKALSLFGEAQHYAELGHDSLMMVDLQLNEGDIYLMCSNIDEAFARFEEARLLSSRLGYEEGLAATYVRLAEGSFFIGDYAESVEYIRLCMKLEQKNGVYLYTPLLNPYLMMNYAHLGEYDSLESEIAGHEMKYSALLAEKNQMHSDSEEVGSLRVDNAELKDRVNRLKYAVAGLSTLLVVLAIYTIVSGRSRKEK